MTQFRVRVGVRVQRSSGEEVGLICLYLTLYLPSPGESIYGALDSFIKHLYKYVLWRNIPTCRY